LIIMFVKPAPFGEGDPHEVKTPRIVRHPSHKRPLAAGGEEVPENSYWRRRLRDGDVLEAERPLPPSDETEKEAPASVEGERTEIQPEADGSAVFTGDHEAETAKGV
jgi:hypothetical protein